MKIDKSSYEGVRLSELGQYVIKIVNESNRRPSNKLFDGKPNCSGYNINQYVYDVLVAPQGKSILLLKPVLPLPMSYR